MRDVRKFCVHDTSLEVIMSCWYCFVALMTFIRIFMGI